MSKATINSAAEKILNFGALTAGFAGVVASAGIPPLQIALITYLSCKIGDAYTTLAAPMSKEKAFKTNILQIAAAATVPSLQLCSRFLGKARRVNYQYLP